MVRTRTSIEMYEQIAAMLAAKRSWLTIQSTLHVGPGTISGVAKWIAEKKILLVHDDATDEVRIVFSTEFQDSLAKS